MTTLLVGGGPDTTGNSDLLAPFLDACTTRNVTHIGLILAGSRESAQAFSPEYLRLLPDLRDSVEVVPLDEGLGDVGRFDALIVGGGPTPIYHDALMPAAPLIREAVDSGIPYLGFSAGAMIASRQAILGGYQSAGRDVCPADWSEGLSEVTVQPGLGLVPWSIDVHAAQAGTLGRAVDVVTTGTVTSSVAVDEDTALHVGADGSVRVIGTGRAWWIDGADEGGARIRPCASS